MLLVYNVLIYLCSPLLMLYLMWRTRKTHDYKGRWSELLGVVSVPPSSGGIWLHAVSLGEVRAALPLIRALLEQYSQYPLVVTTMTKTGSMQVQQQFGDRVFHVYVPLDFQSAVKRFLKAIKPRLAIFMETEVWPNKISLCAQQNIPIMIANARLSPSSMRNYTRLQPWIGSLLAKINWVVAQSEQDAQSYQRLGMPVSRISTAGNIKFEIQAPADSQQQAQVLRQQWGGRPVWIAASTHEGEEEVVLEALVQVRQRIPDVLLLIVPRHPKRFNTVKTYCEELGYQVALRTVGENDYSKTDIFIGNTTGEMMLFYTCADVAFVGGSLVPIGGHNLLEPAVLACPVLTGPHYFNAKDVYELLRGVQACLQVDNADQLAAEVIRLLAEPEAAKRMGQRGQELVERNRGSLQQHMDLVERLLN